MKCMKCGAELIENATFCGNCGSKIENIVPVSQLVEKEIEDNELKKLLMENVLTMKEALSAIKESSAIQNAGITKENQELHKKIEEYENSAKKQRAHIKYLETKIAELEEELSKKKCPGCGNLLTEEMKFCNVCGRKVKE